MLLQEFVAFNLVLEFCSVDLEGFEEFIKVLVNIFFLNYFLVVERGTVSTFEAAHHGKEEAVARLFNQVDVVHALQQTSVALELRVQLRVQEFW